MFSGTFEKHLIWNGNDPYDLTAFSRIANILFMCPLACNSALLELIALLISCHFTTQLSINCTLCHSDEFISYFLSSRLLLRGIIEATKHMFQVQMG